MGIHNSESMATQAAVHVSHLNMNPVTQVSTINAKINAAASSLLFASVLAKFKSAGTDLHEVQITLLTAVQIYSKAKGFITFKWPSPPSGLGTAGALYDSKDYFVRSKKTNESHAD